MMSCLRLAAVGSEGKDVSKINRAQIKQRSVDSNQHLDFLF